MARRANVIHPIIIYRLMEAQKPHIRMAKQADMPDIKKRMSKGYFSPCNYFWLTMGNVEISADQFLIAEIDGEFAGFLQWYRGAMPPFDTGVEAYARIVDVMVESKFRDRNVGIRLVQEMFKAVEREGISVVYADPSENSEGSIRTYETVGFTRYGGTVHMRLMYPPRRKSRTYTRDEARELMVFSVELKEQCRMFTILYKEIVDMIQIGPPEELEAKREFSAKIWSKVQASLAIASVISKILWPQPAPRRDVIDKYAIQRALRLRIFLKLQGSRSLLPLNVRNAFEHIDEKIDLWLPKQPRDIPWGWSLSPFTKEEEPDESANALRYFNIFTGELRVYTAYCNLHQVAKRIRDIETALPDQAKVVFGEKEDWDSESREWKNPPTGKP